MLIPAALAMLTCGGSAEDVTADEILRRAEAAYAAASTYRDHGVSESILTGPDGEEWTSTVVFSTAFRRPSDFRLTYRSSERQWAHAILANSSGTQTWVEGAEIASDQFSDRLWDQDG